MSLIDDIRRDRDAGTHGPWRAISAPFCDGSYPDDTHWIQAIDPTGFHSIAEVRPGCDEAMEEGDFEANACRIARVPDMETALLAAEKMAELLDEVQRQGCEVCSGDCASASPPVGYCPIQNRSRALEAYRAATKGGDA